MKQQFINLVLLCGLASPSLGQMPLTGDMSVRGLMHVAEQDELAAIRSEEVSMAHFEKNAFELFNQATVHALNEALRYRGSATLSDGTAIQGHEDLHGKQPIDPRTPLGFGDPFFRQMHIELNGELSISPVLKELIDSEDPDSEYQNTTVGADNADAFIDSTSQGFNEVVKTYKVMHRKNVTHNSPNYYEIATETINRTTYYNGTAFDFVDASTCITSNGKRTCSESSYVTSDGPILDDITLFPGGICPHPCECVGGLTKVKSQQEALVEQCYDYCAGTSLIDIMQCNVLTQKGIKLRKTVEALIAERLPGAGPGMKVKRSHPLGRDITRFLGVR
mmetsp:Transcript_36663/g.44821  ORF Transcript_36663/g.44821 Transcript_36663/m.44821 type:complete len:335 (+) Transcript_36663:163-1167(+)